MAAGSCGRSRLLCHAFWLASLTQPAFLVIIDVFIASAKEKTAGVGSCPGGVTMSHAGTSLDMTGMRRMGQWILAWICACLQ